MRNPGIATYRVRAVARRVIDGIFEVAEDVILVPVGVHELGRYRNRTPSLGLALLALFEAEEGVPGVRALRHLHAHFHAHLHAHALCRPVARPVLVDGEL